MLLVFTSTWVILEWVFSIDYYILSSYQLRYLLLTYSGQDNTPTYLVSLVLGQLAIGYFDHWNPQILDTQTSHSLTRLNIWTK